MAFGIFDGEKKRTKSVERTTADEIVAQFTQGKLATITDTERHILKDAGYEDLLADMEENLAVRRALEAEGKGTPPWMH